MGPAVAQNYLLCSSPHKRGWPGRHGNTTDAWPWHLKDLCLSRGSRACKRWAEYDEAGSVVMCSWNQFSHTRAHKQARTHTYTCIHACTIQVCMQCRMGHKSARDLENSTFLISITPPFPYFAWRELANWRAGFVRRFSFFMCERGPFTNILYSSSLVMFLYSECVCVCAFPLIRCPPLPILLLCLR